MAVVNLRARSARSEPLLTARTLALWAGPAVWAGLAVFLAAYNLERYPSVWFDEGMTLHVPKALVQLGVYADVSSEGFRYFGPSGTVGPTVLLPIALAFRLFGIGLVPARLVMVAYLLIGLALFALAARRQYCTTTAAIGSALLIATPGINLIWLGRQVLGETPALVFLLAGFLFWRDAVRPGQAGRGRLLAASVAFGLAALTKSQVGLVLGMALAVFWLVDRLYYRRLRLLDTGLPFVAVGTGVALGVLVQLAPSLGSADIGPILTQWREVSGGAIFVFSPGRTLSSLKFLTSADALTYWGLAGVCYGIALARRRTLAGVQQGFLVVFAAVGLAWFAFASIGWPRYAFAPLVVATIFAAKLLRDLVFVSLERNAALGAAISLALTLVIGQSLVAELREVATADDQSPQLMAAYLEANVPTSTVVETWEEELGFLTDHRYHYPSGGWLNRAVRVQWLGTRDDLGSYEPFPEARPSYLVVGRFAKYTGIYRSLLTHTDGRPIVSIGEYDLYRLS
ncbi:MAG TPA: glycosyltransferase family 39 protein [Chloroflexota bacterium]|nr:glycosyltransferase family 39 protein [Chloroflexota bacterium]